MKNQKIVTKTVLITGATRGIGNAIATDMKYAGYNLILTGTNKQKIKKLSSNDNSTKWLLADFSTRKGINYFIKELKNKKIDICINNAGINIIKPFEKYSNAEIDKLLNINLIAPTAICKLLLPNMKKRGFGRIVNIASIWSTFS